MSVRIRCSPRLVAMAMILAISSSLAVYQPVVILKYPFASEHPGPVGNVSDSLVRRKTLVATVYRTGRTDNVTVESTTNDSGFCRPLFDRWPRSGSPIEPGSVECLDVSLC